MEQTEPVGNYSELIVNAVQDGFARAAAYHAWDSWSLDRDAIWWIAQLVIDRRIQRVAEFGAGYSTIALAEVFQRADPAIRMDSFEHQQEYADRIGRFLPEKSTVEIHSRALLQVDDAVFERLFSSDEAYDLFVNSAVPVPKDRYHETRLRNVFYHLPYSLWEPDSVDLLILDGPNGNGRSMAFAFLKAAMRTPGWILMDDYLDYPFLEYLQRVFTGRVVRHVEAQGKEFVLFEVTGRK